MNAQYTNVIDVHLEDSHAVLDFGFKPSSKQKLVQHWSKLVMQPGMLYIIRNVLNKAIAKYEEAGLNFAYKAESGSDGGGGDDGGYKGYLN